jgi:hypothetical protein
LAHASDAASEDHAQLRCDRDNMDRDFRGAAHNSAPL